MRILFLLSIFTAIVIGLLFPVNNSFNFLIPIFLGTIILSNMIDINFRIRDFFRKEIIVFSIINYLILPLIVFLIILKIDPLLKAGLLLIAITPAAIGSSIIVKLINGDVKLSISLTVLSNLMAIFSYPFLLKIYLNGTNVAIPVFKILLNVIIVIIVPFFLSILLRRIEIIKKISHNSNRYLNFLVSLIIYISISQSSKILKEYEIKKLLFIIIFTIIIAFIYFLTGFLLSRKMDIKKAFSSSLGQKNTGLCIWIAISNFPPIVALPATIYIIIHHLINAFFILIFKENK
ncbi:MAG TPA: bile acid:sodium symporter [Spirochaetota bacterium]|nr:bile acid:sodium symporter [Spirochaetota bacterium]HPP05209.1 bile acid:sodium symporter [Spirochaetota bacterium]